MIKVFGRKTKEEIVEDLEGIEYEFSQFVF